MRLIFPNTLPALASLIVAIWVLILAGFLIHLIS